MPERVLITGAAGFLGSNLARRLAAQGVPLVLYDLRITESGQPDLPDGAVIPIRGDILDARRLVEVIQAHHVELVVHLAAMLTADCERDPLLATKVNCAGAAAVFEAAAQHGVRRVLFGSSVAVFDADPDLPTGDGRPYRPTSVYGATKVYCELLAAAMRRARPGLDLLGLRFGWVYGPGRDRGWTEIQEVINGFALEREIVPYPAFAQPHDWTYIDDAVDAIVSCMSSPASGQIAYNVSGDYRRVNEAVAYLQRRFPHVQAVSYNAELYPVGWQFTSDHITAEAGFAFRVNLEEGLERTIAAVRAAHGLPALPKPGGAGEPTS
ncbi:MAG: NAD-dependent epimerase/dehydratase [Anaerolineae bacterium]